ncbi:hypothetical protein [Spiroplasma apis]|uniref:Uncharacterized protein n=1 Tax=Spiroplasma apis B31 TaxID=1276258 RepID=V5RL22_SPIAP|nr:hypothetical protein [Spiroplasma apis]AHB36490.1 hypothetical protein SAPIS_v1c06450 [Spiroplasma apis B31]
MEKPNLVKDQMKFINGLMRLKKGAFSYFILDQTILLSVLIVFIYNFFYNISYLSILIFIGAGYLLFKFVLINWFKINTYYKSISVFKIQLHVDRTKVYVQRNIDFSPLTFLFWTVASNFFTAVLVKYEILTFLETSPKLTVVKAFTMVSMDMLLVPTFINSFNTMAAGNQSVTSNYIKLIKDQYYSNESLFDDVEFESNYLNLTCVKPNLKSKNGIFVLLSQDDLNNREAKDIKEINNEILKTYSKIWTSYYDLLQSRLKSKFSKSASHKLYWMERIYDHIFLDFFEI